MKKKIIALDLGGTKCAAGVVEVDDAHATLQCVARYTVKLADTSSLEHLISCISAGLAMEFAAADAICVGAAGQYDGEKLIYAGAYPYPMNFAALAKQQRWPVYAVVHDYTPVVCATFTNYMQPDNIQLLNEVSPQRFGRRIALGFGTGVGMKDGVLFDNGDFWLGTNEVGHIGINQPPECDKAHLNRHAELIKFLQQPITYEKILTGQGIANLFQFFYPNETRITPEEVGLRMQQQKTPELMEAFAWYLGLFIGGVQLTFMPEAGTWITGGVALNHLNAFQHPEFFAGINASPAYLAQRKHAPLGILCNPDHALLGGAYYATKRLLNSPVLCNN